MNGSEKHIQKIQELFDQGLIDEAMYQTMMNALPRTSNANLNGSGAVAQGNGATAAGEDGVAVGGNLHGGVVIAKEGATVIVDKDKPVEMTAVDRQSALGRYLDHIISQNRYLQLQGIRSGGRLVHIELDRIYITLRTIRKRDVSAETEWLSEACETAPGELLRKGGHTHALTETVTVSINEALSQNSKLVILGDPGSGKTTLLRYLTLMYARDIAEDTSRVKEQLGLNESQWVPVMLPLRKIGNFLKTCKTEDDGTEGHALLLEFLLGALKNERIFLPETFFDQYLSSGQAVVFLDGLDEVADPELRRRVSGLVESFVRAYGLCRYIVTSRIVGYVGSARLGENFKTTTIQDFSMADINLFLTNWHRSIAIGQYGTGATAESHAAEQTGQLLEAIKNNERIRELAINPLMLTVIAMVHRDRVKLPDRRAELYAEAVDVLLGKWEEAKGVKEIPILDHKPFDTGDRRLALQSIALTMHENEQKEISGENLRSFLKNMFIPGVGDEREAERAAERFLDVIEQRTGILAARGEGVYSFSHLTFQEYLAALAIAGRDDYTQYTLRRVPDRWWREVILLEAGHLSIQSKERTSRLIRAIADLKEEPEPYHNLVLAAECLRDAGGGRVEGDLEKLVQGRLRQKVDAPPPFFSRVLKKFGPKGWIEQRGKAVNALVRAGAGYWTMPHGEPEWIDIPAGKFIMGEGSEANEEELSLYYISRVPITNAQYRLFVKAVNYQAPEHWEDERPPKRKESHPVVIVDWNDAMAYCKWLSETTGKNITLPTEAQWEKVARGGDQRIYPWGDSFDSARCNSRELGLGSTTPVGIFSEGASPYGVLDMAGNVWEWCLDEWGADRVIRGGAWNYPARCCRAAFRNWDDPEDRNVILGFRCVLAPPGQQAGQGKG